MSKSNKEFDIKTSKQAVVAEECFEHYYNMGSERSLLKIEKEFSIPLTTLQEWEEAFGWQQKIQQRNAEIEREFDQHYKAKSKDIRNRITKQMEILLDDMQNCSIGLPFQIRSVDDMRKLAQAYESLVRANNLATMTKMDLKGKDGNVTTWAELMAASDEQDKVEDH